MKDSLKHLYASSVKHSTIAMASHASVKLWNSSYVYILDYGKILQVLTGQLTVVHQLHLS